VTSEGREEQIDEVIGDLHRVLLVASRRLRSRAATEDVSVAQFSVLAYLHREGESTPGRLAEFEHVSPPVMTRMIARLESAGLLARHAHPSDRRQILLALTEAGRSIVEEGRRARNAWLHARISHLSEVEIADLQRAADTLGSVLLEDPQTD
jgi:DNA-binding MarR family transcriptional regulator